MRLAGCSVSMTRRTVRRIYEGSWSAGGVDLRSSEAWADAIDALVSRALRFAPTSPDIAAALLDLIADGLDRDDQPRADRADLKALEAVAHYVRRLGG